MITEYGMYGKDQDEFHRRTPVTISAPAPMY